MFTDFWLQANTAAVLYVQQTQTIPQAQLYVKLSCQVREELECPRCHMRSFMCS